MRTALVFGVAAALAAVSVQGWAAHPKGDDCQKCHTVGSSEAGPKVIPKDPGFFEKLFQKKQSFKGHATVSCTGAVSEVTVEGVKKLVATGCHAIDKGGKGLLAMELKNKPVDEFCVVCHEPFKAFGSHHPSYRTDKNGDGVGDTFVVPAQGQEILNTYVPAMRPEPLKSYPDSFVTAQPDEKQPPVLVSALPLSQFVEQITPTETRVVPNVVTCATCHNPHFGYLSAVGTQEELKADLVGRQKGDVGLRMRDFDNALCLTCH